MNTIFAFGLERMFQVAGSPCKTVIDREVIPFFGILDQQSELNQDDRGVNWVDHMFRLTVMRDIATRIPRDIQHQIAVDNEQYTVRHVLLAGDGQHCELYLTKNNPFGNECTLEEICS
jgi:hypothetical protein